jgi:uncharacterized protein YcbK (DUF882 family)
MRGQNERAGAFPRGSLPRKESVASVPVADNPPPPNDTEPPAGPSRWRRRDLLLAAGLGVIGGFAGAEPISAPRSLKLTNVHTKESFDGPYRDESGPIAEAMIELAVLLRDHHVDKIGPLHVETLDFLADVMAATGQGSALILSAYRTPETNAKLARTTFGVAERSQHMFGRALDVSFDHRLVDAKDAARGMKRGGVGWYPISHFIHIDTGTVRNWELDGSGLDRLLAGRRLGPAAPVASRMARLRALAKQQYLARHR